MTGVTLVSTARKTLVGDTPRATVFAFVAAIAFTACIIILDILLQPFSTIGWKGTILDPNWLLFFVGLLFITAVYSYMTGGILDCWLIIVLPLSISFITFLSVGGISFVDSAPIWNWPADYDYIGLMQIAITSAVRWSLILGTAGFVIGKLMKLTSSLTIER